MPPLHPLLLAALLRKGFQVSVPDSVAQPQMASAPNRRPNMMNNLSDEDIAIP